jgi:hypothetical protein
MRPRLSIEPSLESFFKPLRNEIVGHQADVAEQDRPQARAKN